MRLAKPRRTPSFIELAKLPGLAQLAKVISECIKGSQLWKNVRINLNAKFFLNNRDQGDHRESQIPVESALAASISSEVSLGNTDARIKLVRFVDQSKCSWISVKPGAMEREVASAALRKSSDVLASAESATRHAAASRVPESTSDFTSYHSVEEDSSPSRCAFSMRMPLVWKGDTISAEAVGRRSFSKALVCIGPVVNIGGMAVQA